MRKILRTRRFALALCAAVAHALASTTGIGGALKLSRPLDIPAINEFMDWTIIFLMRTAFWLMFIGSVLWILSWLLRGWSAGRADAKASRELMDSVLREQTDRWKVGSS